MLQMNRDKKKINDFTGETSETLSANEVFISGSALQI
jgi:hypothetical protein